VHRRRGSRCGFWLEAISTPTAGAMAHGHVHPQRQLRTVSVFATAPRPEEILPAAEKADNSKRAIAAPIDGTSH